MYSFCMVRPMMTTIRPVLFQGWSKTITGVRTGYDGLYFAALVPWSVTEPADAEEYSAAAFSGYADGKYRNTFYTSRLRIEKLDSETGENILHDSAIFAFTVQTVKMPETATAG